MTSRDLSQLSGARLSSRLLKRRQLLPEDLPFHPSRKHPHVVPSREFSSYDYLNLRKHPAVLAAAARALYDHGLSACASRVLAGELNCHQSLEAKIADIYSQQSALVFVSGHATNVSTIAALVEPGDLVVMDQLCHNSIQVGGQLSGARVLRCLHNNESSLAELLKKHRQHYNRCLIVTEGLFSMDGDCPNLTKICDLRDQYDTWLMVDEAHSLGVLGHRGLGSHDHQRLDPTRVDIWMGTLSKTLGSTGGYVATSQAIIEHLRFYAPGFTFSVGLNAPCCAAAEAALDVMLAEPERVALIQANGQFLLSQANRAGLNIGKSKGAAIVPIILDWQDAIHGSNILLNQGWSIYPVLPPAVPPTSVRLRLFVRSDHTQNDLHLCVQAINEATTNWKSRRHAADQC